MERLSEHFTSKWVKAKAEVLYHNNTIVGVIVQTKDGYVISHNFEFHDEHYPYVDIEDIKKEYF
jgi:hypothetical protein